MTNAPIGSGRILNPIVRFTWNGWESDTLTLQQNGWEISVEQDLYANRIRFALRHHNKDFFGLTGFVPFDYMQALQDRMYTRAFILPVSLASQFRIQIITTEHFGAFTPIDAHPEFGSSEINSLDDLCIFREASKQDIIVPDKDVSELLQEILWKQAPSQAKIRERILKGQQREFYEKSVVHARILSMRA